MSLLVLILFAAETFAGVEITRDCPVTSGFPPWRIRGFVIANRCHPGNSEAVIREPSRGRDKIWNGSRIALRASGMTAIAKAQAPSWR